MNNTVVSDAAEEKMIRRYRLEKSHEEYKYLHLLKDIMDNGVRCPNRTGVDAITIPHASLSFDLSNGFPLLTTKKMAWKVIKVELEGFIKGITSKKWYQDRGCHIWDEWCNPQKVPYGHDEETKRRMKDEDDLGVIYGSQWRNFNNQGYDQLRIIVDTLKKNPSDRRMVCSAFNPLVLDQQSLPPCHLGFIVNVIDGKINLSFQMRSVDVPLGMPFNIASYSLLLHLLCKETGLKEGIMTGFFNSVHIYSNQFDGIKEQINRVPYKLPKVNTTKFTNIFDWCHEDSSIEDYICHTVIKMPIAV